MEANMKDVKIGGIYFTVLFVDKVDEEDNCGESDVGQAVLKILKGLNKLAEDETVIHEIVHAINSDWSEERVTFFSQALFALCRDNFHLRDIFFGTPPQ